jgi:hypothetical protein
VIDLDIPVKKPWLRVTTLNILLILDGGVLLTGVYGRKPVVDRGGSVVDVGMPKWSSANLDLAIFLIHFSRRSASARQRTKHLVGADIVDPGLVGGC